MADAAATPKSPSAPSNKVTIKVHLLDGSFKTLMVDAEQTTAASLLRTVSEKVNLMDKDMWGFGLFVQRLNGGSERSLEDEEFPCKNIVWDIKGVEAEIASFTAQRQAWEDVKKQWETHFRYVFKRRLFMKDESLSAENESLVHMLYIQAVHDVLSGDYPCQMEDAITLGALKMQVDFGDFDQNKHISGYLTSTSAGGSKLSRFIPTPLVSQRAGSELEQDLFAEFRQLSNVSKVDAQLRYLNHVRKWFIYGSLFWNVKTSADNNMGLPTQLVLAVNCDGIHLLQAETKELISSHSYTDVFSWAYKINAFAFVSGNVSRSKYQFETDAGKDIGRTLQAYVDVLLARHRASQSASAAPST